MHTHVKDAGTPSSSFFCWSPSKEQCLELLLSWERLAAMTGEGPGDPEGVVAEVSIVDPGAVLKSLICVWLC